MKILREAQPAPERQVIAECSDRSPAGLLDIRLLEVEDGFSILNAVHQRADAGDCLIARIAADAEDAPEVGSWLRVHVGA